MSDQENKKIGTGKASTPDVLQSTVEVMKPLVKFSIKALGLLGTVLVHIVKNIPKPDSGKAPSKNDKVIKI